ncbi:MAG: hypothetical protein Ct9H300mP28_08520 [Pseudomonadota bacterium]|nr:MAG: hypothetical protein Ct9H300mP28_08520 [Pseudomonadota bacterium]
MVFSDWWLSDAEDYREGIKERTSMTREWNLFREKVSSNTLSIFNAAGWRWDSDTKNIEEFEILKFRNIQSLRKLAQSSRR